MQIPAALEGAHLFTDNISDSSLYIAVKTCAPRHGNWETGGKAHSDAPGAVGETHWRHPQPLATEGRDWSGVINTAFLFYTAEPDVLEDVEVT